jgi:hypothetical protein
MTTRAPAAASPSASARPIPLLDPVTNAVFPLMSKRSEVSAGVGTGAPLRFGPEHPLHLWSRRQRNSITALNIVQQNEQPAERVEHRKSSLA